MKVATLRNWEQGRTKPNREATLLLRLVEKDPAVIMELESIWPNPFHARAMISNRADFQTVQLI
jgi:hypothetical protein